MIIINNTKSNNCYLFHIFCKKRIFFSVLDNKTKFPVNQKTGGLTDKSGGLIKNMQVTFCLGSFDLILSTIKERLINKSNMFKSVFQKQKYSHKYVEHINHLIPFIGVGEIVNEKSTLKEIKTQLGEPEKDVTDDRENRIIEYKELGLIFKFLKILNDGKKNPVVSFITIKKPIKGDKSKSIYPGLEKQQVHLRMGKIQPAEVKKNEEIWKSEEGKKMKFVYDKNEILETIIIF